MIDAGKPNAVGVAGPDRDFQPSGIAKDAVRGYASLRTGAVLLDRSDRARTTFAGTSAASALTGLVTNDVLQLSKGQGQYAALLTAKGKIIADVRIFAREADLLVDTSARAAAGWWATVRKFINPRLARYTDVGTELGDLGIFGPGARRVVAAMLGTDEATLADLSWYAHRMLPVGDAVVTVARVPDGGVDGYDLFAPAAVMGTLRERALGAGAVTAPAEAFNIARIEAGRPEWGVDMDENTLAQEANLDALHAISFTKGCYTGQETVARIHFRGHVNRNLRGVRFDAGTPPPYASELVEDAGARVMGDVRSVAISPRLGGIALAMVRREVADGAWLTARWDGGSVRVNVVSLPFPG
jgi:tRNA-modifying protein YgfZ